MVGLGFLMWYGKAFGLPAYAVGTWILYFALVISLFSGYRYLVDFWKALSEKKRGVVSLDGCTQKTGILE